MRPSTPAASHSISTSRPCLQFRLPLDPARLVRARQRIRDYLRERHVDSLVLDDVVLAVEEAMTNAMRHSAATDDLEVGMRFEGNDIVFEVADHGIGFDVASFDPDVLPDLERAHGRGLFLIAHLMDELDLQSNGGLTVRAAKRGVLPASEEARGADAEQAQRESRELAILDELEEGFVALDWEYRVRFVNATGEKALRRPRDELIGRRLDEASPWIRGHEIEGILRDAMELGRPSITEHLSPVLGRWIELSVYPALSGVNVYSRDIDDRKRRELEGDRLSSEIRRGEERLSLALSAAGLAAWDLDLATGEVAWNDEHFRVMGYEPGEVEPSLAAWSERIHPDDRAAAVAAFETSVRQGGSYAAEFRVLWPDGALRRIEARGHMDTDEAGHPRRSFGVMIDVTERTRYETELRERERDFNRAQAVGHVGSWRLDAQGESLVWSEENSRIFGAAPGTPQSYETFLAAVHPDDRAAVDREWHAALAGKPYDIEHRIVVEGRVKWVRERAYVDRDDSGALLGAFGITQDVSDRHVAEESLRESERRYRELVESANSAIIRWQRDGTIVFFNEYAERLFGWSAAEALGRHVGMLLPQQESDGADLSELVTDVVRRPERYVNNVNENVARDGRRLWIAWTNRALYDERGEVREILAVGSDLTERRRIAAALRESEEKARAAFAHAVIGFAVTTPDGRYVDVNPAFEMLTGYAAAELAGLTLAQVVHPDDWPQNEALIGRMMSGEIDNFVVESRYRRKDGSDVWVRKSVSLARDAEHAPRWLITLVEDISERKRAEQALHAALEERTRLAGEQARLAQHMQVLTAIVQTASSALEVRELGRRLVEAVSSLLNAVSVSLATADAAGRLRLVASCGVRRTRDEEPSPLLEGALLAELCPAAEPMLVSGGRSVLLPLLHDGRPVGALRVAWATPGSVSGDELPQLRLIAAEIATGLENARRYETERHVATTLREHFVHPLPSIPGLEVAVLSQPANQPELVGGDIHDVFELRDGHVGVLIGDVMGKGVKAASLAETVRSAVRALTFFSPSPGKVLRYVNRLLLVQGYEEFASALLIVLNPTSGQARLASAGHAAPALLTRTGAHLIEPEYGPLLGTFERPYVATDFVLPRRASLVLYTDGLTEARRDGKLFGERRLLTALRQAPDPSPQALTAYLRTAVLQYAGEFQDDLEILVLRRT